MDAALDTYGYGTAVVYLLPQVLQVHPRLPAGKTAAARCRGPDYSEHPCKRDASRRSLLLRFRKSSRSGPRKDSATLYFDDRSENAEAGKRFGFQSVLVKSNHLEEHLEWQEINKNIV